jgi:hydrogenase expression/formation protein HypE
LLIGKIPPNILQNQILPFVGAKRAEVIIGPKLGEDCTVLDLGEHLAVLSTDPITGAVSGIGRLAVHISCNDIAATGAQPIGILLTVLLPPDTTEREIQELMQDVHKTATQLNVAILGGHTEITAAVKQVLIITTALGKVEREYLISSSGAQPGDDIILTKWAGLEGTAILATDLAHRLKTKLSESILTAARSFSQHLSVVPEGITAARAGATAMHDVTEGGIRGALVEIAAASNVGLEVWAEKIPLAPETEAICRYLQIDPFGLISSGAMLITAPPDSKVMSALKAAAIPARIIGRVIPAPELSLIENGVKQKLTAPVRDELYVALERFQ